LLNKKLLTLFLIAFIAIAQVSLTLLHSNGIAGYTNSPGEINCTNCHITYPINSPGGSVLINLLQDSTNNYVAGQTYTVNVKIKRPGLLLYGFDCEALDSNGANAGTISLINPSTTTLINALVNSNNRTNITHYGGVYSTDSTVFSFKWKAPITNIGKINLYVAAAATNGDGYTDGDYIYTDSLALIPNTTTNINNKKEVLDHFTVFPNPAEESATLSYYLSNNSIVTANLISPKGQTVFHFFKENQKGQVRKSISLPSFLEKGIYLIELDVNGHSCTRSIIFK
jgi:hypothetical protein